MRPHEDAARAAVVAELTRRGVSPTQLAREARIDPGTAADFLNGLRWPRTATLGKIERFLGWDEGRIENTSRGYPSLALQADVSPAVQDEVNGVFLDIDPASLDGLTEHERAEVLMAAKLMLLERARGIRQAREGR